MKFKVHFSLIFLFIIALFSGKVFLLVSYFTALLFHEFGHILCAKSKGYGVNEVDCSIFGMKMTLSAVIHPNDEFKIALAGPLANLILCIVCTSLWWLIPETYYYLNNFFWSNLTLCLFNLLPVSPLDGSILTKSLFKHRFKTRTYLILKKAFQSCFSLIFLTLFVISCFGQMNLFFLIVALFFLFELFSKNETKNFGIGSNFVISKEKNIYLTSLFYVSATCRLFELFKKMNDRKYVLFITTIHGKQHFFSEEMLQKWLAIYPFDTPLNEIFS